MKLELGMFIPCKDGVPVSCIVNEERRIAKGKVIFKGWVQNNWAPEGVDKARWYKENLEEYSKAIGVETVEDMKRYLTKGKGDE